MALTQRQINDRLEYILDEVAEKLIKNDLITSTKVNKNQKTIKSGIIQVGREKSEALVLFQKDIDANKADITRMGDTSYFDGEDPPPPTNENSQTSLLEIVKSIPETVDFSEIFINVTPNLTQIILSFPNGNGGVTEHDLTPLLSDINTSDDGTETIIDPINISQFLNIENKKTEINPLQANEFLDTNIFELLPQRESRQSQIDKLFVDLNSLLPPDLPEFDLDGEPGVDRDENGNWMGDTQYQQDNSISYAQDNQDGNIDEEDAYITRLSMNASSLNTGKSILDIYNRVLPYLTDVLEEPSLPQDDRPEYENQSSGYLKFRNLNQGIIIRNTNQDFIESLNPNSPSYLEVDGGFTISMWVRFLDKTSQGTLFNFGNPTRDTNPFGFKLETYVINGNDKPIDRDGNYLTGFGSTDQTWKEIFQDGNPSNLQFDGFADNGDASEPNQNFFGESDTERFVRLVVRDGSTLRGSHVGTNFMFKRDGLPEFNYYDNQDDYDHAYGLMTNTRIPIDFDEWYFICATYNNNVDEDYSLSNDADIQFPDYWNNTRKTNGQYEVYTGLGNKCKVEIISKTDLLKARGFKV